MRHFCWCARRLKRKSPKKFVDNEGVQMMTVAFDRLCNDDRSETRSLNGLSELTTRRNPNPNILNLVYGFIDSKILGNIHIYTKVLEKRKETKLGSNKETNP